MSDFDTLCKVFETMDNDLYNDILAEKSANVIQGLAGLTDDGVDALTIYSDFILCAIAADGKLTEDEFQFLKPILDALLEKDATFGDAQKIFYDNGLHESKDYKKSMDMMVDIIGTVSPELKDDIVLLCLMVCAVDGEVSDEEKNWIKQLIE